MDRHVTTCKLLHLEQHKGTGRVSSLIVHHCIRKLMSEKLEFHSKMALEHHSACRGTMAPAGAEFGSAQ